MRDERPSTHMDGRGPWMVVRFDSVREVRDAMADQGSGRVPAHTHGRCDYMRHACNMAVTT